jgi:hypothetical protein
MVFHPERPILEADVESPPITAVHQSEKRRSAVGDLSSQELVKEAHRLLTHVVSLLNDPTHEEHPSLSFRMARAHALTLLDHLERMADWR